MNLWVKLDVNINKDAAVSGLSDLAFRAFVVCIAEAKQLRSGGKFKDQAHLKAVLGSRLSRGVPALLTSGLLTESGDGVVTISNYSRYQVDPTSTTRQANWRARKGGEITVPEQSREEQSRTTPISPSRRDGKSRLLPIGEILGAKRNA